MGSQLNKKRKRVLYLVKWKRYSEETDWTDGLYENFNDKKLLREFHRPNPQAAKDELLQVQLLPCLLGNIVVQGGFIGKQWTDGLGYGFGRKLQVYQHQKKKDRIEDDLVGEVCTVTPLGVVMVQGS
jgi:hypothetical protein